MTAPRAGNGTDSKQIECPHCGVPLVKALTAQLKRTGKAKHAHQLVQVMRAEEAHKEADK